MAQQSLPFRHQQIITALTNADYPMTVSELARACDCTGQTITNHLGTLMSAGRVELAFRKGNANLYRLGTVTDSLPRIMWRNQSITLHQLMGAVIQKGFPSDILFRKTIVQMIAELYGNAAKAMFQGQDMNVTNAKIKSVQAALADMNDELKELSRILNELLSYDELWDGKELPKTLITRDPRMTDQRAMDIWTNLVKDAGTMNKEESDNG